MPQHKLSAITDPQFVIELPDGTQKTYDLYELAETIQVAEQEAKGSFAVRAEKLREVFGIPTLTRRQAFTLQTEVLAEIAELPESKKLLALSRNS